MKSKLYSAIPTAMLFGFCLAIFSSIAFAADEEKQEKPKVREVKVDALTLTVPESWEQKDPSNKLRKAQFEIPKAKDGAEEVEFVIFSFGGGGGGIKANLDRWIGQFESKDRKSKITMGESPHGKYIFADISGTYKQPVGPPIAGKTKTVADGRMLAVILAVDKAKEIYYLRIAGDGKTVTSAAKAFRASFGADAEKEKEFKPGE